MVNTIVMDGRLSKRFENSELRTTSTGKSVIDFFFIPSSMKKDDKISFMKVTLWGSQAEYFATYNQKGDYVLINGNLKAKYNEEGKQSGWEISAQNVTLISAKGKGEQVSDTPTFEKPKQPAKPKPKVETLTVVEDDELPF